MSGYPGAWTNDVYDSDVQSGGSYYVSSTPQGRMPTVSAPVYPPGGQYPAMLSPSATNTYSAAHTSHASLSGTTVYEHNAVDEYNGPIPRGLMDQTSKTKKHGAPKDEGAHKGSCCVIY